MFFKLIFLKLFSYYFLLHFSRFLCEDLSHDDFNEGVKSLVEEVKLKLHRHLEGERIKVKRSLNDNFYRFSRDGDLINAKLNIDVNQTQPVAPIIEHNVMNRITSWAPMNSFDKLQLFWTTSFNLENVVYPRLTFAEMNPETRRITILADWPDYNQENAVAIKSAYFNYDHVMHLVILYKKINVSLDNSQHHIITYRIEKDDNQRIVFVRRNSLSSVGYTFTDVIQHRNKIYLAVSVNQFSIGEIQLYEWNKIQFDLITDEKSELLAGIGSVKLFLMSNTIYIASSTTSVLKSEHHLSSTSHKLITNSHIYQFQGTKKNSYSLVYVQKLILFNQRSVSAIPELTRTTIESKIQFFNVHNHAYLIFIGLHNCQIYWWSGSQFHEYQTLENTMRAIDVTVTYLPNNEALIGLVKNPNQVEYYIESINSEYVKSFVHKFGPDIHLETIKLVPFRKAFYFSLYTYNWKSYQNQPRYLNSLQSPIWFLNLNHHIVRQQKSDPLSQCLYHLSNILKIRSRKASDLKYKADRVWVVNRKQVIHAKIHVKRQISGYSNSKIGLLRITSANEKIPVNVTVGQIKKDINYIGRRIADYQNELNLNVLLKDASYQNVLGPVRFLSPVTSKTLNIEYITNPDVKLNNVNYIDLLRNVLRKSINQVITFPLNFISNLNIENLLTKSKINSLDLNDLILTRSAQVQNISSLIRFRNARVFNVGLPDNGKINDLNLLDVVNRNSVQPQVMRGHKRIRTGTFNNNLSVSGLVNRGNLTLLALNSIKLNSKQIQILRGKLVFANDISVNNLNIDNLINDRVNLSKVIEFGLRRNEHQVITGKITFNNEVNINGNLNVEGLVNGLNLEKNVLNLNSKQDFNGELIFKLPVLVDRDVRVNNVNGINFSKEAIPRYSPYKQHVYAHKTFDRMYVAGNLTLKDRITINNVDPSDLHLIERRFDNLDFANATFNDLRIMGNVRLRGLLNGFNVSTLKREFWLRNIRQIIDVPVQFEVPLRIKNLQTNKMNKHDFPQDFVLNKPGLLQVLSGEKIFVKTAFPTGGFEANFNNRQNKLYFDIIKNKLVRNLPLISDVNKSIILDDIYDHKTIEALDVEGNVFVEKVNGLRLEKDVVLRNRPYEQIVDGNIQFGRNSYLNVYNKLVVGGDLVIRNTINNVKILDWYKNLVLKEEPEIHNRIIKNKIFKGKFSTDDVRIEGKLSGINLTNLFDRAVKLKDNFDILVPITFANEVIFRNVTVNGRFNSLNLYDFERSLVYKSKDKNVKTIVGIKEIYGNLTIRSNLNVRGNLAGLDLAFLSSRSFSKTRPNRFTAPVVFKNNLKTKNVILNKFASINGVQYDKLVKLNENSNLNGKLNLKDAEIKELWVESGIVNNCNLHELFTQSVLQFQNNSIGFGGGSVTFKNLEVKGNLNIRNHHMNNLDLDLIRRNFYGNRTLKKVPSIRASLIFLNEITVDNLVISNKMNNVDIGFILKDAVLKSVNQRIPSIKVFVNSMKLDKELMVFNYFKMNGLFGGVDLARLNHTIIRKNVKNMIIDVVGFKNFNKSVRFENNLHVYGRINQLRVPQDLVSIYNNEIVGTTVVFKRPVEFYNDFNVIRDFNKINLRAVLDNAINLNKRNVDENSIRSVLRFHDKVRINNLLVTKTINGVPINLLIPANNRGKSRNLLRGSFVFEGNVLVDGRFTLKGLLNGFDLAKISKEVVDISRDDYLPGKVVFSNKFVFGSKGTVLYGAFNNLNLANLVYTLETKIDRIKKVMQELEYNLGIDENRVNRQIYNVLNKPSSLEYFEIYDEFNFLDENNKDLGFERFVTDPLINGGGYDSSHIWYPTVNHIMGWRIIKPKKTYPTLHCEFYETLIYHLDENDDLELQKDRIISRAFPSITIHDDGNRVRYNSKSSFMIDFLTEGDFQYYLWSNTTGCRPKDLRYRNDKYNEVTLLYTSRFDNVSPKRKIVSQHETRDVLHNQKGNGISAIMKDAKFFIDASGNYYSFVVYSYSKELMRGIINSTLYQYNNEIKRWTLKQEITTYGGVAADIVHFYPQSTYQEFGGLQSNSSKYRMTFLAIANQLTLYNKHNLNVIKSFVYRFNEQTKIFDYLTSISTSSPRSVLFLPIYRDLTYVNSTVSSEKGQNNLFLIFANEKSRYYDECTTEEEILLEHPGNNRKSSFDQTVMIYRLTTTGNGFIFHQSLNVLGANSLDKFYLPSNEAYVAVASKIMGKTFVYHFNKPRNQFLLVQEIPTPYVENVKLFWSKLGNLYMMVASPKPGYSKRFKAFISGPSPYAMENLIFQLKN